MITRINEFRKILESSTRLMYHVSLVYNRESIKNNGLNATGITPWPEDEYPKGTYLCNTVQHARKYGFGNGDPYDIWSVDTSNYIVLPDPLSNDKFGDTYYISEDISPKDIALIESHEYDVTNPIK